MGLLMGDMHCKFQCWTSLPCTLSSWLCLQLFLHLIFIQSGMLVAVMGLRLESISVPQSGIKGSSVMLGCEYRLDGDEKLYSLKWYKDSHEFFRFMPKGPEPTQTFNQPGVYVEGTDYRQNSNHVVFKLKNLALNSGGTYKCEISADAPTFKTLAKESNLSVIVLPKPPTPQLSNFPKQGQLGGRIRGNCTYAKSYPAAKLTLYVNDAKVNNSDDIKVRTYDPKVDGDIEEPILSRGSSGSSTTGVGKQYQYPLQQQISSGRDGMNNVQLEGLSSGGGVSSPKTYTSVSGIEFRLDRHHFRGERGHVLTIRCVAGVVDQLWDTQTNITLHNYQPPQLSTSGQKQYSSGSDYLLHISIYSSTSILSTIIRLGTFLISWIFLLC